jgi:hypothetical protein
MLRHHAALVSGKLTRVISGVNLPPLEVIMSRHAVRNSSSAEHHKRSVQQIIYDSLG